MYAIDAPWVAQWHCTFTGPLNVPPSDAVSIPGLSAQIGTNTTGAVCGNALPAGLQQAQQLEEVIFTPATKAEEGHDENISFEEMVNAVGSEVAEELRRRSIDIYLRGAEFARDRGVIIADTKFEFGMVDDEIILIDEVLTPDSSRFWPADQWEPGSTPPSFD